MQQRAHDLILAGRLDEAQAIYAEMVAVNPGDWLGYLGQGRCEFERGSHRDVQAIGFYQEVTRLAPDEAGPAYWALGEIFHRKGRPSESVRVWFQHAAEKYLQKEQMTEYRMICKRVIELGLDPV